MTAIKQYRATGPAILFVKAEWCPHCQAAKPEIRKAAAILGTVLPVYMLDSKKDKDILARMPIEGYPTIFFRTAGGQLKEYSGDRTGQKIADWACAKSGACGR